MMTFQHLAGQSTMRHLKTFYHLNTESATSLRQIVRHAARGIVLRGENILLLYTARYHDYSLPGGGIDDGEDVLVALSRELTEETGAQNIRDIIAFGRVEEYRLWHKPDADIMHMISYCYRCNIDATLGQTQLQDYEHSNGMRPVWINIHQAIAHNQKTIAESDKKGMSIERETYLLKRIASECL